MDAIDARIAELREALEKAGRILAEPEIRQGLVDPARAPAAATLLLLVRAVAHRSAVLAPHQPVAAPEPVVTHEPERVKLN